MFTPTAFELHHVPTPFQNTRVSFFETVIRHLGGLLSAYALTNDTRLRTKADELGTRLSPAFDTKSGFPAFAVNTYEYVQHPSVFSSVVTYGVPSGVGSGSPIGSLAEIASFQLEYTYLGKITGKKEHIDRVSTLTLENWKMSYIVDEMLPGQYSS